MYSVVVNIFGNIFNRFIIYIYILSVSSALAILESILCSTPACSANKQTNKNFEFEI